MSLPRLLRSVPAAIELDRILSRLEELGATTAGKASWDECYWMLRIAYRNARAVVKGGAVELFSVVWKMKVPHIHKVVYAFLREGAIVDLFSVPGLSRAQIEAVSEWRDVEQAQKRKIWREWSSLEGFGEETEHVNASTLMWQACERTCGSLYVSLLLPWFQKHHPPQPAATSSAATASAAIATSTAGDAAGEGEEEEAGGGGGMENGNSGVVDDDDGDDDCCEGCVHGSLSQYEHTTRCIMSGKPVFCCDSGF